MKSIVILGDSLSGGGVQRVILNLSKGFVDAGCQVHILLSIFQRFAKKLLY